MPKFQAKQAEISLLVGGRIRHLAGGPIRNVHGNFKQVCN